MTGAREETTLSEVVDRIRQGSFYEDYDWASGPALRAISRAEDALKEIVDLPNRDERMGRPNLHDAVEVAKKGLL